jgi:hypothetical protein
MSCSDAQLEANRLNSQKCTGPRTEEGKERSSQNAIKLGMYSGSAVIPGEDPEQYQQLRRELIESSAPAGDAELQIVERIVLNHWKLRRLSQAENFAFRDQGSDWLKARKDRKLPDTWASEALCKHITHKDTIAKVMDWSIRLENQIIRLQNTLRLMQTARRKQESQNLRNETNSETEKPQASESQELAPPLRGAFAGVRTQKEYEEQSAQLMLGLSQMLQRDNEAEPTPKSD